MANTLFCLRKIVYVSYINGAKININLDNTQQSEILKLKNGNDDIVLYQIGLQVMEKSGFLSGDGQAYGYYAVDIKNSNNKASLYYTSLFNGMIETANLQSEEINYLLREAGPITDENTQSGRTKIAEFFKIIKY